MPTGVHSNGCLFYGVIIHNDHKQILFSEPIEYQNMSSPSYSGIRIRDSRTREKNTRARANVAFSLRSQSTRIQNLIHTVFTRLNAAAFIEFLAFPMRRLVEGGVYFKIIFLKSLTTRESLMEEL